jgi:hypothetical protein
MPFVESSFSTLILCFRNAALIRNFLINRSIIYASAETNGENNDQRLGGFHQRIMRPSACIVERQLTTRLRHPKQSRFWIGGKAYRRLSRERRGVSAN